jgi:hypothetical protein
MPGFAVIDNQPGDAFVAIWLVGHTAPHQAGHVNTVTIDRYGDRKASEKLRLLTRNQAVVLSAGSTSDSLPVEGEVLTFGDVEDLIRKTEDYQHRITESVQACARRTLGVGEKALWAIAATLGLLAVASTITVVQRILVVRTQSQALATPPAAAG